MFNSLDVFSGLTPQAVAPPSVVYPVTPNEILYPTVMYFDHFDAGFIDAAVWNNPGQQIGWISDPPNHDIEYQTAQTTVSGTTLKMVAEKLAVPINLGGGNTAAWKSGAINTEGKLGIPSPSSIFARIKFPPGKGFWPSMWMLRPNALRGAYQNPHPTDNHYFDEIDVPEWGISPNLTTQVHVATRSGNAYPLPVGGIYENDPTPTPDPTNFHVYGVERTATNTKYYVDGILVATHPLQLNQIMHLIFNFSVIGPGATWSNNHWDATTPSPSTTEVDWVLVRKA